MIPINIFVVVSRGAIGSLPDPTRQLSPRCVGMGSTVHFGRCLFG